MPVVARTENRESITVYKKMFHLTSTERKVLILLAVLILIGAVLRYFSIKSKIPVKITNPIVSSAKTIININNATALDLEHLPGVGSQIASEIIVYRQQHGNFTSLNDLDNVKGIGEKKLEVIKKYLSL